MKKFFLFTNQSKDKNFEVSSKVKHFLEQNGKECEIAHFDDTCKTLDRPDARFYKTDIPKDTDLCIAIGGDGTMLQAARNCRKLEIPLLGINMGTVGYLTEVDLEHMEEALTRVIEGKYTIEKRMMLKGFIKGKEECTEALNDIVIARAAALSVITLSVYVNDRLLTTYQADGIIVSTPTGSTGYNMSAGGPIVEPKSDTILLTPICPHTLNSRSIVLSSNDKVELELVEGRNGVLQEAEASFDGRYGTKLQTGDRLVVSKSDTTTRILKINEVSFLEILHKKLG
ncbi:NAD(+)/NADH kinase [Butyrivibrio sp. NC3005]|uniref:NAD(+)/NADH kinase n=1 Tax=Butyrivibrio sp. NC3005 TaxID=1280685 RepID=UPI00042A2D15|nr:NAD(+)/NADH kinase [Butyrivibrio sp. NC3005]